MKIIEYVSFRNIENIIFPFVTSSHGVKSRLINRSFELSSLKLRTRYVGLDVVSGEIYRRSVPEWEWAYEGSKDETFRDLEPGLDGDNIDYAGNNGKNGIVVTKAEEMVAMMEILPLFVYQSNMNKSLETLSTKKPTPRGNSFHWIVVLKIHNFLLYTKNLLMSYERDSVYSVRLLSSRTVWSMEI